MTDEVTKEHHEKLYVFLFLSFFLVINIYTATIYPYPNSDECMFVEPAMSFLHGHGFGVHFSEMLSMYSFLLVPWVRWFGFSMRSVRGADVFFMTAAFGLFWSAVKRLDLVGRMSYRLLMLFLLATEFGMIVSYRTGRYDGLGALLLSLVFWLMSLKNPAARWIWLFAFCLVIPWAGPQYLPVIFSEGVVLCLFFPRTYWKEVLSSFLGSGAGSAIFLFAVAISGRLPSYLKFVHHQQDIGLKMIANCIRFGKLVHTNAIPADFSLPFLFAAVLVVLIYQLRKKVSPRRSVALYSLAYSILLGCILLLSSKFPTYYSYMVSMPLIVALCHGLSQCGKRSVRNAALILGGLSAAAGIGLNAIAYAGNWQGRNYDRVEKVILPLVRANDIAYMEYPGYYAARDHVDDVYFQNPDWDILPLMSEREKKSVSVILVIPKDAEKVTRSLGGRWILTGGTLAPLQQSVFYGKGWGFLSHPDYQIEVFRRLN